MRVRIERVASGQLVGARIVKRNTMLPSITEGWRFNFTRHSRAMWAQTYVLIADEFPDEIEGCLIYKMRQQVEPYMAYIEVSPFNKGKNRTHDQVAGCLIAYACRLSFLLGNGPYKGWLAFDVQEEHAENTLRLMGLYSEKYGALRVGTTTMMVISPEQGEKLIQQYLKLKE